MAVSSEVAEIIRRKMSQYCRLADTRQLHLFDKVALPGATFKYVGADGSVIHENGVDYIFDNREAFCTFFHNAFETIQVIHSVGPGELEQIGPDEVKAIFTVIYHAGPKGTDVKNHGTGGGHYYGTWRREGDDWFMAALYMQRTYWITRD
ncbi:hypothetical protein J7T55_008948 [Diaporthe amygdali]|uniref:uncharacterized protein n=1 Tax=Phomopsis amygdali TaxID=1214568 RepID=UPI0022FE4148|nr:uncharacterized protein J7T55_008948 [Diaporthe amygdali]KAJ0121781.1 hypothetical protein J7T55_008948 [Diaporthe amygdali]